jgi:hypothetical protein
MESGVCAGHPGGAAKRMGAVTPMTGWSRFAGWRLVGCRILRQNCTGLFRIPFRRQPLRHGVDGGFELLAFGFAKRAANLPNRAAPTPSTGCAFCGHWDIQNRWHTRPTAPHAARSVRRMSAYLLCVGRRELRRVVSSDPCSPVAARAPRDVCNFVGPTRPHPATAAPAASSVAVGCCEIDPTGAAIARSPQGSAVLLRFTIRRLRRLTELNRTGYPPSRAFPGNSLHTYGPRGAIGRVGGRGHEAPVRGTTLFP